MRGMSRGRTRRRRKRVGEETEGKKEGFTYQKIVKTFLVALLLDIEIAGKNKLEQLYFPLQGTFVKLPASCKQNSAEFA